jgi:hypothetical protein
MPNQRDAKTMTMHIKRHVDHLLPRRGLPAVAYFAAVAGLLGLAQFLPAPAYLAVDAVAFAAGGSWCALNFWRCRQAHCLLTGSGWLLLALFAAAEAGLGHSLIGGDEQLVFLAVLAIGLVFEAGWYLVHRESAVTRLALWPPLPGARRRARRPAPRTGRAGSRSPGACCPAFPAPPRGRRAGPG